LKQLQEHQEKATASYEKNDWRTCLYHMDSALKIAPACIRYKVLKAECLAMLGRYDQANDISIAVMQMDQFNAEAIYVRGLTLYYTDNLDKSIAHFQRVVKLDNDHKKAFQMRQKARHIKNQKEVGNQLFKDHKYRDALKCYSEALTIDETNNEINSKLYYNRSLVNTKLGNLLDAIVDCTEALKRNDKYVKALMKRAKCYYDLEKFEECVKDYETLAKIEKTEEIRSLLKNAKLQLKKSKRKDYYKILGVGKSANEDEIKKAYRKRALIHHPDRHANSTDQEKKEQEIKFKEVGEAYTILSDPSKKTRYDSGQDIDDDGHMGEFECFF
jgi:DnaJ homolog subfamily C member 7